MLLLNEYRVLSNVIGLFSGRGYNIVAQLEDKEFFRINIITLNNERVFEQIIKQLYRKRNIFSIKKLH